MISDFAALSASSLCGDCHGAVSYRLDALEECRKLGLECQVLLAYHSQCAAFAGPTIERLSTRGGVLRAAGAGSLEKAKANALRDCQSAEGGQTWILVYSACAVPELFDN